MSDEVTVKTIVADYLKAHGFEGLHCWRCDPCGCTLDDLMPCSGEAPNDDCEPGYRCHHTMDTPSDERGDCSGVNCECVGAKKPVPPTVSR